MMSDDANAQKVPSTTYQRLAERFPAADHKRVNKGGRDQTYIPWTDKVERFNEVLGQDWSFRVVREGMTNTEAWVLGELSVTIDGVTTVRQQYGCEAIVKGQRETPTTDLFKIAGTDALSKAATLFGCGLYLSIQEERAEVEAEMRRPKAPASTPAAAPTGTQANRPASTPTTSPAAPTSSSTTVTLAQPGKPVGPTPLHDAEKAAIMTGANPPHQPGGYFCVECHGLIKSDDTVTILKKKDGPSVKVPVTDFAPVCEQRLGGFHCGGCYDKKYWKVA